jgi:hypothetical protein
MHASVRSSTDGTDRVTAAAVVSPDVRRSHSPPPAHPLSLASSLFPSLVLWPSPLPGPGALPPLLPPSPSLPSIAEQCRGGAAVAPSPRLSLLRLGATTTRRFGGPPSDPHLPISGQRKEQSVEIRAHAKAGAAAACSSQPLPRPLAAAARASHAAAAPSRAARTSESHGSGLYTTGSGVQGAWFVCFFFNSNIYVMMQGSILLLHVGIWDLLLCAGINARLKEERAERG